LRRKQCPTPPPATSAPAPAEAAHLSIVVLPFTNLSGDPTQDYFADGITENLTTDLSRLSGSFVIARNTAFAFKAKNVDVRKSARSLAFATYWKVRCSAIRTKSASMLS
jgi:adenylate cyclase